MANEVSRKESPINETIDAMNNVSEGMNMSKAFNSVEELMEDLNADD